MIDDWRNKRYRVCIVAKCISYRVVLAWCIIDECGQGIELLYVYSTSMGQVDWEKSRRDIWNDCTESCNTKCILERNSERPVCHLKHYLKLDGKINFNELKTSVKNAFKKIKKEHYKNYFLNSLDKSKLKIKPIERNTSVKKIYKD